jgi:hypothetical protein
MQPRLNIAKSAGELIEEEVRRFFINKSTDALRNMPVREILTSKAVEHINTYYKLGVDDYIEFNYVEDKERLRLEDPNIIYNKKMHPDDVYVWMINFIHDYDNFCRKLPFWTLSLSLVHKENVISTFILNPFLDIFLFSEKGSGSVNNQRKVRSNNESEKLIYACSNNIQVPDYLSVHKILSLNSLSVELIYLSRGLIDFYILNHEDFKKNQDCILVARESGIIINDSDDFMILANEKTMKKL